MSDGVYSFRSAPTYRASTREAMLAAAFDRPMNVGSTFFDQAKGGILESFGLGTAVREMATPGGETTTEGTVRSAARLLNPITTPYEVTRLAVDALRRDSPALDEEGYKASPYFRTEVPWDGAMTEDRAAALADWHDRRKVREYYATKRPITAFIGNLAGQAVDPINYVPVAGPLVKAAAVARAGKIGGAALAGALDAAGNTAMFGLATREARARFGDDVSWQATVSEIATAALIGAAFGTIGGVWEGRTDARAKTRAQERLSTLKTTQESRVALNEAIDGLVHGEDVRLSPNATEPMARVAQEAERVVARQPRQGGFVSLDAGDRLGVTGFGKPDANGMRRRTAAVMFNGETFVAGDHTTAIDLAVQKYGDEAAAAIDATPEKYLGYVSDKIDESGVALVPADHAEMGLPEPKAGDDRVYRIDRNGENIGFANIVVDGATARVKDIYSVNGDTRGVLGTAAVAKLLRQFTRDNPDVKRIEGERVSGARRSGNQGMAGTGQDIQLDLSTSRRAVDTSPPRPDPIPEGRTQAEAAIAKPDDVKAMAKQYGVDPTTGAFAEEAEIAQLKAEGRLTDDDVASLDDAKRALDDGEAYGEALKAAVGCLI